MNVNLSVAVYQERIHDQLVWHTVSLGPHDLRLVGRSEVKLQRKLIRKLQKLLADLDRSDLVWFHVPRGQRLLRVRAELVLTGGLARRRLTGRFPLVCQPRAVSDEARRLVLFHPKQTSRWFSPKDEDSLEDEASLFLRHLWKEQDEDTIRSYESDGKDRLLTLSFNASITSLPDELKKNDDKRRADQRMRSGPVLAKIGSDETQRAVEGTLPLGVPREPYRRQLGRLLGARRRQSTVVLGPAQVGACGSLAERQLRGGFGGGAGCG